MIRRRPASGARGRGERRRRDERGVSLIELIVATGVLGAATVTILGAFGTLIKTSDLGRKTADLGSSVSTVAENVSDNAVNPFDGSCAPPPAYDPTKDLTLPVGMTASVTSIEWWYDQGGPDGKGAFVPTCHVGVQLQLITVTVTVRVTTTESKATRSISVVKRG